MHQLAHSEKRWMTSFAIADALFWLFMLGNCSINPDLCEMGAGFSTAGFYAPFWFWMLWLDITVKTVIMQIVAVSLSGLFGHLAIGYAIGRALKRRTVGWRVSVPLAFMCVGAVSIAGNAIGRSTGVFT